MITKATAHLIVTACNACQKVNPDNPQAVAESIEKMYEALKEALIFTKPDDRVHFKVEQALAQAEQKGAS